METVLGERRRELSSRRYGEAMRRLHLAVDYLYKEGAREVYPVGSLLHPERFTEHSDLDLAVRGMDEGKHLEIEGKLADLLGDLEYDILFLEDEKYLRKEILKRINEEAVLWKP